MWHANPSDLSLISLFIWDILHLRSPSHFLSLFIPITLGARWSLYRFVFLVVNPYPMESWLYSLITPLHPSFYLLQVLGSSYIFFPALLDILLTPEYFQLSTLKWVLEFMYFLLKPQISMLHTWGYISHRYFEADNTILWQISILCIWNTPFTP